MSRGALFVLVALFAGSAHARPVEVICPGGVPALLDTLVFDYPVIRSPALLSLRAPSMVRSQSDNPASSDTASAVALSNPGMVAVTGAASASTGSQASLLFSGSKSLAVEMGRGRDASLHQTLDLTVRGRVAGDVEMAATLSDQELPFEPDGTGDCLRCLFASR